jgi:hypothetical protein
MVKVDITNNKFINDFKNTQNLNITRKSFQYLNARQRQM